MTSKHALMPGLEKPGAVEKMNEALKARNDADYACFMLLRELLDSVGGRTLHDSFYDPDKGTEWVKKALATIEKRDTANDMFLRTVSGND